MSDAYMQQLERINTKLHQFHEDPARREADNRWKHNFLNSIQAIKEGRDVVSVASGGSRSTINRMKTMGLTDTICTIAEQIENTYCPGREDTVVCKAIDALQDYLGCGSAPPGGLPDGSACTANDQCLSGFCGESGFCSSI